MSTEVLRVFKNKFKPVSFFMLLYLKAYQDNEAYFFKSLALNTVTQNVLDIFSILNCHNFYCPR
jgi:hypothetical protein